jgi:hypothetical protein
VLLDLRDQLVFRTSSRPAAVAPHVEEFVGHGDTLPLVPAG